MLTERASVAESCWLQAFVDEFSCIGCRNCNNVCPQTFGMEDDYGCAAMQRDLAWLSAQKRREASHAVDSASLVVVER